MAANGLIWIASTSRATAASSAPSTVTTVTRAASRPCWRTAVCETSESRVGESRYRHHLLTLAGTQIVYCTHNGAVVAIDALTGRRNWAIRYPRRTMDTEEEPVREAIFAIWRPCCSPRDGCTWLRRTRLVCSASIPPRAARSGSWNRCGSCIYWESAKDD